MTISPPLRPPAVPPFARDVPRQFARPDAPIAAVAASRQAILDAVLRAVHDCRPSHQRPGPDTAFAAYGLDSLDRVAVAVTVEDATGLSVPDDALTASTTSAQLTDRLLPTTAAVSVTGPARDRTPGEASAAPLGVVDQATRQDHDAPAGWVDPGGQVGERTRLWHQAQIAAGAVVGRDCTLGKGAFVGTGSHVGNLVKIGNYASVFGAHIEDEAMISPGALLLEDPAPRATTPTGDRKGPQDFGRRPITVGAGATIGAGAVVLPGVRIGAQAMVGAGAVVTRDVPPHAVVTGNPARQVAWACRCGHTLDHAGDALTCRHCHHRYTPTTGSDGVTTGLQSCAAAQDDAIHQPADGRR